MPFIDACSPIVMRRLAAQAQAARSGPVTRDLRLGVGTSQDPWWRVTLQPLGERLFLGSAHDITDLKQQTFNLTEDLVRQIADLASVRSLAGLAAHDTRAPLANLVTLSDLILEDFTDQGDGKRDLVQTCRDVARGALEAVETVMERVDAREPARPRRDRIDFGDLCRDAAALADPAGRIAIVFPEAQVETDGVLLRVGLRNLLDNAVRYASDVVEIALDPIPTEGQIAVIVADDGPGFAKGSSPLGTPKEDGRGFGLGAVLRLVTEVGGSLTPLPPRLGHGATIRLALPGHQVRRDPARSARKERMSFGT